MFLSKKVIPTILLTALMANIQASNASNYLGSQIVNTASEDMSQGSAMIIEGSFVGASGAVIATAEGSEWVIKNIEHVGNSVVVTMVDASDATVKTSIQMSKATAQGIEFAVNGIINVVAVTVEGGSQVLGYTLSSAGKVLLYIANEAHQVHTSSEKIS